MIWIYITYISLFLCNFTVICTDIYASVAQLGQLLEAEEHLVKEMRKYVTVEKKRIKRIWKWDVYLLLRHLHLIASSAPTSVVNLFAFKIIIYCFATPKQLFSYLVTKYHLGKLKGCKHIKFFGINIHHVTRPRSEVEICLRQRRDINPTVSSQQKPLL